MHEDDKHSKLLNLELDNYLKHLSTVKIRRIFRVYLGWLNEKERE